MAARQESTKGGASSGSSYSFNATEDTGNLTITNSPLHVSRSTFLSRMNGNEWRYIWNFYNKYSDNSSQL